MTKRLDLIAFDGDDTLWHNERSYREGRERFRRLLARAGVVLSPQEIEDSVNRTEIANLPYYGYGVSSFVLSLAETAIDLTDGRISGGDLRDLIALAKHMLTEGIELFPGAQETLAALSANSPGGSQPVLDFATNAVALGLMRPAVTPQSPATDPELAAALASGGVGDLVFEVYEDMKKLILLDPVHEVDESRGWPTLPKNS